MILKTTNPQEVYEVNVLVTINFWLAYNANIVFIKSRVTGISEAEAIFY